MSRVLKLERSMGKGCTEPFLGQIETENQIIYAVIKTKDNEEGVLSVINEFICYNLAKSLGLIMPNSDIAIIDHQCYLGDLILKETDYGNCFYSEYINSVTMLDSSIMTFVENTEIFEEIIIFDHIIYNWDRNEGNLILSTSKDSKLIYAIDHSHVFKNQVMWNRSCFKIGIEENDYLDNRIMSCNKSVYDLFFGYKSINRESLMVVARRYKKIVSRELLSEIINKLPSDWEINRLDLDALIEYILYRVEHLEEICDMIINYRIGGEIL